jgi:hypothetical protein
MPLNNKFPVHLSIGLIRDRSPGETSSVPSDRKIGDTAVGLPGAPTDSGITDAGRGRYGDSLGADQATAGAIRLAIADYLCEDQRHEVPRGRRASPNLAVSPRI